MPGPSRIEGYAIISADGMIAAADGHMPEKLKIEADQRFFHAGLDRAAAVVQGRNSYEGGPNAPRRRRLIVTRRVPALAPTASHRNALFWNPAGASLADAWGALGATEGTLAVIGGADVYELFWDPAMTPSISRAPRRRVSRWAADLPRPRARSQAGGCLGEPWAKAGATPRPRSSRRGDPRYMAALGSRPQHRRPRRTRSITPTTPVAWRRDDRTACGTGCRRLVPRASPVVNPARKHKNVQVASASTTKSASANPDMARSPRRESPAIISARFRGRSRMCRPGEGSAPPLRGVFGGIKIRLTNQSHEWQVLPESSWLGVPHSSARLGSSPRGVINWAASRPPISLHAGVLQPRPNAPRSSRHRTYLEVRSAVHKAEEKLP